MPDLLDIAIINGFAPSKLNPGIRDSLTARALCAALFLSLDELARWYEEMMRTSDVWCATPAELVTGEAQQPRWGARRVPESPAAIATTTMLRLLDVSAAALVLRAAAGDTGAFAEIVDRIEGKVGTRKDDTDEELARHAAATEATIERVVEAMTRARVAEPDGNGH